MTPRMIFLAYPDVEKREITEDWEFLVLACDGIWDVMSNEEVLAFVQSQIQLGNYPEEICENLMTKCLAPDCQVSTPVPAKFKTIQIDLICRQPISNRV